MDPSTDDRWARVEQLLDAALQLTPDQRAPFLARACAGDRELYNRVLHLLTAGDRLENDDFLEDAVAAHAPVLVQHALDEHGEPEAADLHKVGPYEVIEELARGGMGVVYRARRSDGAFEHEVALKVIRRDRHSDDIVRRFLAERQILAQLRHAHIAALHDGGTTDDGRPYFVMDCVDGQPITAYCAGRELSETLGVFMQVAAAVQHAHQHLVVHRDLKPSNILVTADGSVKLLDFGIAKLLAAEADTDVQSSTKLLTPAYAAPEQLSGGAVTTATDLYALGVVLYELLAGRLPFEPGQSHKALVEAICEADPAPPSRVLAGQEGASPGRVRRVRGDLDAIVLKCLRKAPQERYATAEALVEDLGNYLTGLPVSSRKGSLRYRALRGLGRNWRLLSGAAVVLVLLGAATLWFNGRLLRERDRTQDQLETSESLTGLLVSLFSASESLPQATGAEKEAILRFLRQSADRLASEVGTSSAVDPAVLTGLGGIYYQTFDYGKAERYLRWALEEMEAGSDAVEYGLTATQLGTVLFMSDQLASADSAFEASAALFAGVQGAGAWRASALLLQANGRYQQNRVAAGDSLLAAANRVMDSLDEGSPERLGRGSQILTMYLGRCDFTHLYSQGLLRAILRLDELVDLAPVPVAQVESTLSYLLFGNEESVDLARRSSKTVQELYGKDHPLALDMTSGLATALSTVERHEEAETIYEEVLAGVRELPAGSTPDGEVTYCNYSLFLMGRASKVGDDSYIARADSVLQDGLRRWPYSTALHDRRERFEREFGDPDEAVQIWEQLAARMEARIQGSDDISGLAPGYVYALRNLVLARMESLQYAEALRASKRLGSFLKEHGKRLNHQETTLRMALLHQLGDHGAADSLLASYQDEETIQVIFQVDMRDEVEKLKQRLCTPGKPPHPFCDSPEPLAGRVGIRGRVNGLSWEDHVPLHDRDQDGIFELTMLVKPSSLGGRLWNGQYKYTYYHPVTDELVWRAGENLYVDFVEVIELGKNPFFVPVAGWVGE